MRPTSGTASSAGSGSATGRPATAGCGSCACRRYVLFERYGNWRRILGRKLTDRKIIHVMEDPGISRGGVLIETAFGDIDATIEAQVEHLRSTILPNG